MGDISRSMSEVKPVHKQRQPLQDLTFEALQQECLDMGEPRFRATQFFKWLYQKGVGSFDEMTNVSKKSKALFAQQYCVEALPVVRTLHSCHNDAVKFGFSLPDGAGIVESVLLYDGKRRSACISSQLGCAMGCVFCETGRMGLIRNLTQSEILGQLTGINAYLQQHDDKKITNIVFMGMGEALANMDAFRGALSVIRHPEGFNISGRRITLSTAGLVPGIRRFLQYEPDINLAISLNAPTNEKRREIMPLTDTYSIAQVLEAAWEYARQTETTVTCEYTVVEGFNNSDDDAKALAQLLKGHPAKVNCIAMNPHTSGALGHTNAPVVEDFADRLHHRGVMVTVRKSRGRDIAGACGQLGGSPE